MTKWAVRTDSGAEIAIETTSDGLIQIATGGAPVTATRREVEQIRTLLGAALVAIGEATP